MNTARKGGSKGTASHKGLNHETYDELEYRRPVLSRSET